MNNKQDFLQYLVGKKKKQNYIEKCGDLFEQLHKIIKDNIPTPEEIGGFAGTRAYVDIAKNKYKFLNDYADFCDDLAPEISTSIRKHCHQTFVEQARNAVNAYKEAIVFIPERTKIISEYLGELTNEEFVRTFKSLQELIVTIYDEIASDPFTWGFPDWRLGITVDGGNNNRLMETFFELVNASYFEYDSLVVDKKAFNTHSKHIKGNKILEGLHQMGFEIEGLEDKKSVTYIISYPDSPTLIFALYSYFKNGEHGWEKCQIFSYRFMEVSTEQTHDAIFLALTDSAHKEFRDLQYWLYSEAKRYGFTLNSAKPNEHLPLYRGCINYRKGSKNWLLIGTRTPHFEAYHLAGGDYKTLVKIEFKKAYSKYPEQMNEFAKMFPDAIKRKTSHCQPCNPACDWRFNYEQDGQRSHRCGYAYFFIYDPTLDDVKALLEFHKLEHNIKSL